MLLLLLLLLLLSVLAMGPWDAYDEEDEVIEAGPWSIFTKEDGEQDEQKKNYISQLPINPPLRLLLVIY